MLRSVAVIVLPNELPFELGVISEVFAVDRSGLGAGLPRFNFKVCSVEPGLLHTAAGFSIQIEHDLSAAEAADLIVMAPFSRTTALPQEVMDVLQAADRRGALIMSVCTGAFALAQAGILNGKRAATHWQDAAELARDYPLIKVDENALYVQDGNIITSAGTAAGIDASLHVIRSHFGAKAATTIARAMVVPPHRDGGQAQYIERPVYSECSDSMEKLLERLAANLQGHHTVSDLAAREHMSKRTFARRFQAETGTTPAKWLTSQRVLRAQVLLEETDLTIEAISREVGFHQSVLLRRHFSTVVGTTPLQYRKSFKAR